MMSPMTIDELMTPSVGKAHVPMTDVEEAAEDARISQLYSMADKLAPADFVALVERLGADDAIVYGGMCTDKPMARAHFIVTALLDTDDQSLAESIEQRKELLKASVAAGGDRGESCMLAAIESFTLNQEDPEKCSESTQTYDKVLQLLWEWDIASEDGIRAWQGDERAARLLHVTTEGARALRERGEVFFDWLEHGEEK